MESLGLKDKVAIVTGGASGIGRKIVVEFLKLDMKVVIVDLDNEAGTQLEKTLRVKGFDTFFHSTDVSDINQVDDLINKTIEKFNTINILVNSAGVSGLSNYIDLVEEEWDWTINTNLKGTHNMCLAVSKVMVSNEIKGRIVNISSINDQIPVAGLSVYSTSKAAITGLSRAIALELAPYGINVNTIRPAAINTPMMKEILELPDLAHALIRQIPKGRLGNPLDVARVVIFLVSNLAEWVTGAEIPVTGGMHLVGETSYNFYFEKEMLHEDQLPDIPFTRPWKKYSLSDFIKEENEK